MTTKLKCIDLFAGCGGLTLGLHRANWECLFAIEKDPMAFETLSKNLIDEGSQHKTFKAWPNWLEKRNHDLLDLLEDVNFRKKLLEIRGSIDLVAGGPPCQGFSVGGCRNGLDERNNLAYRMIEFVNIVKPKAVLIENVEGIARRFISKPGKSELSVADDIISRLENIGYNSAYKIIDASKFGVPQTRRRVVIFSFNKKLLPNLNFLNRIMDAEIEEISKEIKKKYKLPMNRPVTVKEAIDDLAGTKRVKCPDSPKFETVEYNKPLSIYAKLMRKNTKDSDLPNSHRFSKHGKRILNLYNIARETQPPGRLSKEFLLDNGTKKDKKVLVDPEKPISTITTHPDEYIHYLYARNITVREMARLQSFPDTFHFYGRYTINGPRRRFDVARCSQVGNAVPPLMAEGLGNTLKKIMASISNKEYEKIAIDIKCSQLSHVNAA